MDEIYVTWDGQIHKIIGKQVFRGITYWILRNKRGTSFPAQRKTFSYDPSPTVQKALKDTFNKNNSIKKDCL